MKKLIEKPLWLAEMQFEERTKLALNWLVRSIEITGGNGSAGFFQKRPWEVGKWSKAYPETTGYLIETLLDYSELYGDEHLKNIALQSAKWLVSQQLPDGSFKGGLTGDKSDSSVFNTGMILFGLERVSRAFQCNKNQFSHAAMNAAKWLLDNMEPNGSWLKYAYVKGYSPTYYSRVLWSLLYYNEYRNNSKIFEKAVITLDYYQNRILDDKFIDQCGFFPNEPALTHSLAYCLRGFLECSILSKDEKTYNHINAIAEVLAMKIINKGKVAGSYNVNWISNYKFYCLTGNAQLSIIFLKLFKRSQNSLFYEAAIVAFEPVVLAQGKSKNSGISGAISGSSPIWGPYFRFRYPNWATKFYLDAYLLFNQLSSQ